MQNQKSIDFTKIDWKAVDERKAEFFYGEACAYSNGLLTDIRSLNTKAFQLLTFTLPLFCAAVGFLMAVWENESMGNLIFPSIIICSGLFGVLVLLLVATFPRYIYQTESPPGSYFTGDFYKKEMLRIFSFAIASINKYISYNYRIMRFRGKFLTAAIIMLLITPLAAIAVFLTCLWEKT